MVYLRFSFEWWWGGGGYGHFLEALIFFLITKWFYVYLAQNKKEHPISNIMGIYIFFNNTVPNYIVIESTGAITYYFSKIFFQH